MIDVKQAVQIAKEKAAELLGSDAPSLEEIERQSYQGRQVWSITLGFVRETDTFHKLVGLATERLEYKRFLIDVESGELVAMKLREVAAA